MGKKVIRQQWAKCWARRQGAHLGADCLLSARQVVARLAKGFLLDVDVCNVQARFSEVRIHLPCAPVFFGWVRWVGEVGGQNVRQSFMRSPPPPPPPRRRPFANATYRSVLHDGRVLLEGLNCTSDVVQLDVQFAHAEQGGWNVRGKRPSPILVKYMHAMLGVDRKNVLPPSSIACS